MDMPVRTYSCGMKARLAFGMSMGIAFDWYLVDEITAVGEFALPQEVAGVSRRLKDAGLMMVSHSSRTIRTTAPAPWCSRAAGPTFYPNISGAMAAYESNMAAA